MSLPSLMPYAQPAVNRPAQTARHHTYLRLPCYDDNVKLTGYVFFNEMGFSHLC